jgi:type I pantothenate kinase
MASVVALADILRRLQAGRRVLVVGLTGPVAVGKSTLAAQLIEDLTTGPRALAAASISTDGFLRPNAELNARGLTARKGYPETYDAAAMDAALLAIRTGGVLFPGYSHLAYDVDPTLARRIEPPDVLLVEGLGFRETTPLDVRVYLDAEEADLERWYVGRFLGFCAAGREDPASFYFRFRELAPDGVADFARMVWREINLPNLRENIAPLRTNSHVVATKAADHSLAAITVFQKNLSPPAPVAGEPRRVSGGS